MCGSAAVETERPESNVGVSRTVSMSRMSNGLSKTLVLPMKSQELCGSARLGLTADSNALNNLLSVRHPPKTPHTVLGITGTPQGDSL